MNYSSIEEIDKEFVEKEKLLQILVIFSAILIFTTMVFFIQIVPMIAQTEIFHKIFPNLEKNILSKTYFDSIGKSMFYNSLALSSMVLLFPLIPYIIKKAKAREKKKFLNEVIIR